MDKVIIGTHPYLWLKFCNSLKGLPLTIPANQLVVLLHGIARSSLSMRPIEKALLKQGYEVLNIQYPSRTNRIQVLAEGVHDQLRTLPLFDQKEVHFVTHSMGGLVVRALLAKHRLANVNKVVMLGPPNLGSEVADFVISIPLIKAFYGPALLEMTTEYMQSNPLAELPSGCQVGIIAGNLSIDPFCYFMLPKGHDGKVTIARTKLTQMSDHIVLPVSHSLMMYNKRVIEQISYFLAEGRFLRST